jgi:hypothetical protein
MLVGLTASWRVPVGEGVELLAVFVAMQPTLNEWQGSALW